MTNRRSNDDDDYDENETFVIGFFHPRCSSGGGGEMVLWKSIQALGEIKGGGDVTTTRRSGSSVVTTDTKKHLERLCMVVYTINEPSKDYDTRILEDVANRFNIVVLESLPVRFVHLHEHKNLLDEPKRLTMIMESWGTTKLAYRALGIVNPHVYIDTTGCAFTFPIAKYLRGCRILTYVHYPTMSVDMLSLVRERRPSYNNVSNIASNSLMSRLKLAYYAAFAVCYGIVGGLSDLTMANSNWTKGHLERLWKLAGKIRVVFPPVDTASVNDFPIEGRENMIISIGQFRPEKDHALQLRSFAMLLDIHNGAMRDVGVTLVLIGSCRGVGDMQRVDELRELARELNVEDRVKFVLNQPYSVVKDYLHRASVGIHTMWNEYFGIGVVEMMAAGLVTIAHNSGGPKSDIILRPWDFDVDYGSTSLFGGGGDMPTGCLATTSDEYAATMYEILKRDGLLDETIKGVREAGRKSAERFSDEEFLDSFKETVLSSSLFESEDANPLLRFSLFIVVIAILLRYY
ncbi:hypothetical protein ACHAXA_002987 [Cyclostephanos tholiformis]|uniref:GDP-Man:Man(3)GlcNAc(2)-PP-Dol alpha-1,2-mannosyltransferase n=1 Tax=Cyclostephanos tholiformis TaxID=382380 RepID=A0ABD3SC29_9STRA